MLGFGLFVLTLVSCRSESQTSIELVGPSGLYRVKLVGGFAAPRLLGRTNTVTATVTGRHGFSLAPFEVYHSDALDRSYRDRFLTEVWAAENAVQLVTATDAVRRIATSINVENQSGSTIPLLQIDAMDLIFAFGIAPGVRQSFAVLWGPEWDACVRVHSRDANGGITAGKERCVTRAADDQVISFNVVVKSAEIVLNAREDSPNPR